MRPSSSILPAPLRTGLLVLGLVLSSASVQAQSAPQIPAPAAAGAAAPAEPLDGRRNQKIEHITVEDRGAKVDEVRYGGVTQSITVQPKDSALPSYDIQPTDGTRQRTGATDGNSSSGGQRVWNVLKF